MNSNNKCPNCSSEENIRIDNFEGRIICTLCGLIIDSVLIDAGEETIYKNDDPKKAHTSGISNYDYDNKGKRNIEINKIIMNSATALSLEDKLILRESKLRVKKVLSLGDQILVSNNELGYWSLWCSLESNSLEILMSRLENLVGMDRLAFYQINNKINKVGNQNSETPPAETHRELKYFETLNIKGILSNKEVDLCRNALNKVKSLLVEMAIMPKPSTLAGVMALTASKLSEEHSQKKLCLISKELGVSPQRILKYSKQYQEQLGELIRT